MIISGAAAAAAGAAAAGAAGTRKKREINEGSEGSTDEGKGGRRCTPLRWNERAAKAAGEARALAQCSIRSSC